VPADGIRLPFSGAETSERPGFLGSSTVPANKIGPARKYSVEQNCSPELVAVTALEIASAGYRAISVKLHPDKGGSLANMTTLTAARDDLRRVLAPPPSIKKRKPRIKPAPAGRGRQIETEAAPIRYVAELVGADTNSERAIRWLIALMVLCCDPLAIALTAAASATVRAAA
jgi:hypothetical protein